MSLTLAHLRICLSNCMDVSEGRKALHHRQARSIHERKLLSLSLRAGFHKHTHPHAHRLAHAHEQSPLLTSLQELAAMRNLATCELDKTRHLVMDVRTSKRHMSSSTSLVTRCRPDVDLFMLTHSLHS